VSFLDRGLGASAPGRAARARPAHGKTAAVFDPEHADHLRQAALDIACLRQTPMTVVNAVSAVTVVKPRPRRTRILKRPNIGIVSSPYGFLQNRFA
jgi:hypothetical protein